MTIDLLLKLMPPPSSPINTGNSNKWKNVEKELGVDIPTDYKSIISAYGSGSVDYYLWLLNPFESNEYISLLKKSRVLINAFIELRLQFPERYNSPVFPELGGLLPWAFTDSGVEICWIVGKGNSDDWTVGIHNPANGTIVDFKCNAVSFMVKLLSKEIVDSRFFPDDFPQSCPTFVQP
jgi:hypothetical protein